MPHFETDNYSTPFGQWPFLRSTRNVKTKSYMLAAETVPARTIDGHPNQKILNKGTVLALITSGPHTGKVGPFQAAGSAAAEVQTITPGTAGAAPTSGTFTITLFPGVPGTVTTAPIAFNANGATVQAAIRAALATSDDIVVQEYADSITATIAGGSTANLAVTTITFANDSGANVPQATVSVTGLNAGATMTVATGTQGAPGALDGRQTAANIVGICNTFLPWQTIHRDVEVAVIYEAAVVQANCIELNADGVEIALTNSTAAEMFAKKGLNFTFHTASSEI